MTMNTIKELIDNLPFRASFYDKNSNLLYSNNQSDGSFFPEDEEETLPQWILEQLQSSSEKSLHLQVPTDSFDQILMQSYQAIYNQEKEFVGVITYIQDLKPILSSYLKESGQAIVGWSDVTSGASISNHLFDE